MHGRRSFDYMRTRLGLTAAVMTLAAALPASALAAPTDLGAYWPLNESKGAIASDASNNHNDGAITGATRISGRFSRALRFDGVDDQVLIPRSSSMEPAAITVEGWVRAGTSPGMFRHIVSQGAYLCEVASYGLTTGSNGGLAFYVSAGSDDALAISPVAPATVWDGAWHHVAGTFDGATVRLYVDGAEVGTGTSWSVPIVYGLPTAQDGLLGAFGGSCASGALNYGGDFDEPRIWRRALSAQELAASAAMGGANPATELTEFTDSSQSVVFTSSFSSGRNMKISLESATGAERITSVRFVQLLPIGTGAGCGGGLLLGPCDITLSNGGRTAALTVTRQGLFSRTVVLRVSLASGRSFDVSVDT
jgi:hypothetical protein